MPNHFNNISGSETGIKVIKHWMELLEISGQLY